MKRPTESGERAIHFIIDNLLIVIFSVIVYIIISMIVFSSELNLAPDFLQTEPARSQVRLLTFFIFLMYYILFESILGKTPGKMATGSIVVRKDNTKPRLWQVIVRTLLRLTGFDLFSYLFGTKYGLHDWLTQTMVVKQKSHPENNQK